MIAAVTNLELSTGIRKADWQNSLANADRRDDIRNGTMIDVMLTPMDEYFQQTRSPRQATLLNYSEEGACIDHSEVLAEPYALLQWTDADQEEHQVLVRLKWCRSKGGNHFLTGGRISQAG